MAKASKAALEALTVRQLAVLVEYRLKRGRPSAALKDELVQRARNLGVTVRDVEGVA
jgi:hypothetical protein